VTWRDLIIFAVGYALTTLGIDTAAAQRTTKA